ncbi:MAG: uracil-DNA glycosylase [Planctomyces sp.]|nr:uracil-DNA glycosylase [Planctomyces sp.]
MSNSDLRRAVRQSLEVWRLAGVTHLPRPPAGSAVFAPAEESSAVATSAPVQDRPTTPASALSGEPGGMRPPSMGVPAESGPSASSSPNVSDMANVSKSARVSAPLAGGLQTREERSLALCVLADRVATCVRCSELAATRTQTVFGVGNPMARVMFVGEAPGADEDAQGEPFVGRAGQLLNRIIAACGWQREELYICNILRCRPPGNRTPHPVEAGNCREYLDGQIRIVDPDYIVCWGSCAAQNLLGVTDAIGKLRQRFFTHGRAQVLCTYHPSYLLRNPSAKKPVWDDMQLLLQTMGLKPPSAQGMGGA